MLFYRAKLSARSVLLLATAAITALSTLETASANLRAMFPAPIIPNRIIFVSLSSLIIVVQAFAILERKMHRDTTQPPYAIMPLQHYSFVSSAIFFRPVSRNVHSVMMIIKTTKMMRYTGRMAKPIQFPKNPNNGGMKVEPT